MQCHTSRAIAGVQKCLGDFWWVLPVPPYSLKSYHLRARQTSMCPRFRIPPLCLVQPFGCMATLASHGLIRSPQGVRWFRVGGCGTASLEHLWGPMRTRPEPVSPLTAVPIIGASTLWILMSRVLIHKRLAGGVMFMLSYPIGLPLGRHVPLSFAVAGHWLQVS